MPRANALAILFTCIVMSGCALSPLDVLPNPLEPDKGLEVNAQVGQNNIQNQADKKQLAEVKTTVDASSRTQTVTSQKADTIQISNKSTETYIILLLCFFAGLAIPTRGQANMIKQLRENLEYERARTDVTVRANAGATYGTPTTA